MSIAPLKTTTALVATLSMLLPHPTLVSTAWAQEAGLLCLDESEPPCPEGEPEVGSTPVERAEFAVIKAAEEAAAAEAETQAAEDAADPETIVLIDPTIPEANETQAAATPESAAEPQEVVEETLDAASVRSSDQDFATAIDGAAASAAEDSGRSGLSNFEKALLLGLGAVVVGSVLRNGDRVVANTGDRVVVEGPQGLSVYKDDDALLREPGAVMRTETFADGSSRTTLDRVDGSQVITISDSHGRVLRRAAIYPDGTQYELFDDLQPEPAVDVRQLQATRPIPRSLSVAENDLAALRAALREEMAFDAGRTYSLRQIREIEQVRSLVPAIDLDTVTFATGSAAISATQARSLVRLGILIEELLLENPREVFLIEGHTDAVGSKSYNLTLSDRRAESVALALTESFRIPPENLIVQGYGESFLKVQTETTEERNRRATVRRITPLLRQIAAN
ncbi:OmpA family protein [Pseudophaeobacter flagellatus]|uniref:OmpA family protein n=1 Tax=Pseudophaeobacter flagellatus TaxID=2899119 RepID=UPI001E4EEB09|nr:OmpA family protein [Pseudophaeobacter flagellatus]MCD9150083.1 OmpA family protein [Pseudophaeobacter flagellatus]